MYSRVYLEITNICNKNCSFCPGTTRKKQRITPENFRALASRLRPVTDMLYLHLMGEPLTHPQLGELISIARELGFRVGITTNATLLSRMGQMLLEAGLYKINLSLHSFEDADENAQRDYVQTCALFAREAAKKGTLVELRLWNSGSDDGRNALTLEVLRRVFPEPWETKSRSRRLTSGVFLAEEGKFDWPDLEAREGDGGVYCRGLKDHFGVLVDGTVVPCCLDREGTLALGNLHEQPIQDILNAPRARAMAQGFRNRNVPEELCRKCGYARRF